jgi:uncharacterized protein (DUF1501 family)
MPARDWKRRTFLKVAGLALTGLGVDPVARGPAIVAAPSRPARRKTLVCVCQRGGVDGLSIVVPHADPHYYQARPTIAIPRPGEAGGAVDLDGWVGLHPALAPLAPWYRQGSLAAVCGVGSLAPTRSHFDAQVVLETGRPGVKSAAEGWLNRYLQRTPHHEGARCRALAIGRTLPLALCGRAPAGTIAPPPWTHAGEKPEDYPASPLGRAMRQIAHAIRRNPGLEIAWADTGGWDTHVSQGAATGPLAERLNDLARSMAAFATDLAERMADVVVLTLSEFGRSVRENGLGGTDHGGATALLILGGATCGGRVFGRRPTIARNHGDIPVTTDVRDLIAELLVKHLGVPAPDVPVILPGCYSDHRRWLGVMA